MLAKDFKRYKAVYLMAIPVVLFYLLFHYKPMYGAIIAFKNFSPAKGIWGSPWIGFKYFQEFFSSYYFWTILRNTFLISLYELLWGFPAPIVLALMLNEITNSKFKRTVQTVTYIPHFISLVVICGLILDFTATDGVINSLIAFLGGKPANLMIDAGLFRTIYVSTGIWQGMGWGSIIYLAALSGIDQELYSAATIDGAGKWKQVLHVTIPGIAPTIIILLILRMGKMLNVGFEKIILLYNPLTYDTADVISTFVYRKGLLDANYGYASAVGLFNSVINFALLIFSNKISRKYSETRLW